MKMSFPAAMAMLASAAASTPNAGQERRSRFRVPRMVYASSRITARSRSRRYPQMVTSSDAEIAEHNRNVATRQVRRRLASGRGVRDLS